MNAVCYPFRPAGSLTIPSSKSFVHRALICASLADKPTVIYKRGTSSDIAATVNCLNALNAVITERDEALSVEPRVPTARPVLNCGESGSTLRFLLPLVCALGCGGDFTGQGRLAERPLSPLYEELLRHGISLSPQGKFPLTVRGKLSGGEFVLDGGVSSQFFSGLAFALPFLGEASVRVAGRLESAGYLQMTLDMISRFGIVIKNDNTEIRNNKLQKYISPGVISAEGDWSNAAFPLLLGALSPSGVTVRGLQENSLQGDKKIVPLLTEMGVRVERQDGELTVRKEALRAFETDVSDIPDMVPALALLASLAKGESVITGAARLRLKESDRLESIGRALAALGADVQTCPDGFRIRGKEYLHGGTVDSCNDHRIAMMASCAAAACETPVTVLDFGAVRKSYPTFAEDMQSLGADIGNLKGTC